LNGDYILSIHASDAFANNVVEWQIGAIKIWFKEGKDDGNNLGVKEQY